MGCVAFEFAGEEVAGDDAAGFAVDDHYIQHFVAVEELNSAQRNLPGECLISAQQQLLAGFPQEAKVIR